MNYFIYKIKKLVRNYFFDHPHQKSALSYTYALIVTALSAIIFSFGFKCFIQPNYSAFANQDLVHETGSILALASSGASGMSQSVLEIFKLSGLTFTLDPFNVYVINFISYFVINIPLLLLAYFKIGKKFAFLSLINVVFVTIFGIILPTGEGSFIVEISEAVFNQPVARILFAGLCTGVATALSYLIESTCGGIDIIAYYISEKKSTGVGIYSAIFNFCIVMVYSILSCCSGGLVDGVHFVPVEVSQAAIIFLYTFLYMIITTLVVDTINISNKKLNLQIISKDENLSQVIMSNIPHGCTVINGKGGFTGKDVYIISVTVRKSEQKRVIKIAKKADPSCFINVLVTEQVYGKFFRKPIK